MHRDVSPQNILISDEGDIKLCDFGIAKAASKVSTTMSGALKGKLQYMSPEQAWGKRLDRRSDIFSLGSVLYEMLTAAPLFEGDTDMSVLESVREGEVAPPTSRGAEVPKRVDQIVLKALAKNPQERYQNASEFEKDLHAVLYTYQPSPGPADLAIYMHRLVEAPQASEDEIDAAFDAARDMPRPAAPPAPAPEAPPKKGKGLVIAKAHTGEFTRPSIPVPAPLPAAGGPPRRGGERGRARAPRGGRVEEEPRRPRRRDRHRGGGARRRRALRDEGPLVGREAARHGARAEDGGSGGERVLRGVRGSLARSPRGRAGEDRRPEGRRGGGAASRRRAREGAARCGGQAARRRRGSPRPRPRKPPPSWRSRP